MKLTSSARLDLLLQEMGITSPLDVIARLPRRYDSFLYTPASALRHLQDKEKVVLFGKVILPPDCRKFAKASLVRFLFRSYEGNQDFEIEAWNRHWLAKTIDREQEYTIKGAYDAEGHCLNLISMKPGRIPPQEAIVPVYSLPTDYPEHSWRQLVKRALEVEKGKVPDIVPAPLREKYRLLSHYDALAKCHFPTCPEDIHQGQRVLKYEEALSFSLKNQLIRSANKIQRTSPPKSIDFHEVGDFVRSLPYPLTGDQKKAVRDGLTDMNAPELMYRLLQGDVGTGKTLVAAILLYGNYCRGKQGAILAPTDALARQHYESLKSLYASTPVNVGLLVGAMSTADRKAVLEGLKNGTIDIAVGTHALFSEGVTYADLGFAVIDEQHKFGVNQRRLLCEKGDGADVLLMSATPIPRTLSLTLYGDLDVSVLAEFPAKERRVVTKIVKPNARELFAAVSASVSSGHRVFIIAPQIENREEGELSAEGVYSAYKSLYPGLVGLLHGRLSPEEKERVISKFKEGVYPILVSTSVVEVGIDVKEANLMIIYGATHFGLSSLHQLRGRIGRGGDEATCLLVYGGTDEKDKAKLGVLTRTNDGFKIAEADLKMRGPGEVSGLRQSGIPSFRFVNLYEDLRLFECAREDAAFVLAHRSLPAYKAFVEGLEKETSISSLA
ncbi:MAG: ATP-dependent DNA helicase RecG [Candidatus Enteromonas sp.]